MRKAFTLIEMTIVIAIIAILAGMALSVYNTAAQQSKGMRTRAIIAKIDQLIGEKYEGYRTRQVPIRIPPMTRPDDAARIRLDALRELQRMEMPDRITDVTAGPAYADPSDPMNPLKQIPQAGYLAYPLAQLSARPAPNKQYLRRAFRNGLPSWSTQNENAECLYLILSCMRDGDKSALDYFSPTEIGDVDDDGMNEILDSFGQPIAFLRWAPGYRADAAPFPVTPQEGGTPDPFDPFLVYGSGSFALKPLIWSAGPDKRHGISVNTPNDMSGVPMPYAVSSPPNDPYWPQPVMVGWPFNEDATDNITNHDLEAR